MFFKHGAFSVLIAVSTFAVRALNAADVGDLWRWRHFLREECRNDIELGFWVRVARFVILSASLLLCRNDAPLFWEAPSPRILLNCSVLHSVSEKNVLLLMRSNKLADKFVKVKELTLNVSRIETFVNVATYVIRRLLDGVTHVTTATRTRAWARRRWGRATTLTFTLPDNLIFSGLDLFVHHDTYRFTRTSEVHIANGVHNRIGYSVGVNIARHLTPTA